MNKSQASIYISVSLTVLLLSGVCLAEPRAETDKQMSASAGEKEDHDALRALVPMYEKAANEGKPEVLKSYLDPDFTGVMVTGEEVGSFASLQDYWAKMQELMGPGGKYHVKVNVAERSILSGNLAVAHGTTSDDVTTSRGRQYHFEGRWTAVCRKQDGQWKVLRIHGSMDPVFNPFVVAAVRASAISIGAAVGIVCLIVGWCLHVLWNRRRKTATNT
jgi:ketosteroid isomerase-like protein